MLFSEVAPIFWHALRCWAMLAGLGVLVMFISMIYAERYPGDGDL
jgi:hypothetical protein